MALDGKAKEVYGLILDNANRFLTHGLKYRVEILALEDPSYKDVAELIETSRQIIHPALEAHDIHLAYQANEYCYLMGKIGLAIATKNQEELNQWCEQLRKKPFVMPE